MASSHAINRRIRALSAQGMSIERISNKLDLGRDRVRAALAGSVTSTRNQQLGVALGSAALAGALDRERGLTAHPH